MMKRLDSFTTRLYSCARLCPRDDVFELGLGLCSRQFGFQRDVGRSFGSRHRLFRDIERGALVARQFFHGGDPKRALLIRQSGQFLLKEAKSLLKRAEKQRLKRSEAQEVPGQAVKDGIIDLERALTEGNARLGLDLTTDELEIKVTTLSQ